MARKSSPDDRPDIQTAGMGGTVTRSMRHAATHADLTPPADRLIAKRFFLAMKWMPVSYYSKKLEAVLKEKDSKKQEYYPQESDCVNVIPAL